MSFPLQIFKLLMTWPLLPHLHLIQIADGVVLILGDPECQLCLCQLNQILGGLGCNKLTGYRVIIVITTTESVTSVGVLDGLC